MPIAVGALVCTLTVGAASAAAQGVAYTQITRQTSDAALGGLADLARGLGADIPTETVEEISLSADGRKKLVRTGHQRTIYDLDGFVITIDEEEMTWERKTAEQIREQMQQLTQITGGGTGPDRAARGDAPGALKRFS